MNRLFAETYARDQEIEARYDNAELKNDSVAMEQARTDHFALEASIQAQGKPFELLYSLYAAAMKVGNEYIDLSELHEYRDAKELIDSFREYGVEAFTFSSGWSSATESAWAFLQNGCTLAGMVEINGLHKAFGSDEYEKRRPSCSGCSKEAVRMLQIGRYTAPQDGRPAIIQREFYGQGYIFKDETAFLSHPDQVCYVPELSDTAYTHNDLLAVCDHQEKLAQRCFDCLNWQSPTTWVDEQFIFGEWVRCEECHRVYDAEEHSSCPHCGNEQDGDSSEQ